jgi:hypothetical protein
MKINIFYFFKECFLKMAFPLLLSLGLGFLINFYIPASSFIVFLPKAFLIGCLYFGLMWLLGLNDSEKKLITNLVKKGLSFVMVSFKF